MMTKKTTMTRVEKRPLTLEQTHALYIINKAAKEFRDLRKNVLKQIHSFLSAGESIEELTDQELNILKKSGLDSPVTFEYPNFIDGFDAYWQWLYSDEGKQYRKGLLDEIMHRDDYIYDFWHVVSEEDRKICVDEDYYSQIGIDTTEEEMAAHGLSEPAIEELLYIQDIIKETYRIINKNYEVINSVKNFNANISSYYEKCRDQMYKLKDCILTVTDSNPVAYHKMEYYDNLAAYYSINGFKFHMFVDVDDIDIEKIDKTISIDLVSAENKLEEKMSLEEAVGILLEYLGYDREMADAFIEGSGPNICSDLDIEIITPEIKGSGTDYCCESDYGYEDDGWDYGDEFDSWKYNEDYDY